MRRTGARSGLAVSKIRRSQRQQFCRTGLEMGAEHRFHRRVIPGGSSPARLPAFIIADLPTAMCRIGQRPGRAEAGPLYAAHARPAEGRYPRSASAPRHARLSSPDHSQPCQQRARLIGGFRLAQTTLDEDWSLQSGGLVRWRSRVAGPCCSAAAPMVVAMPLISRGWYR